MTTLTGQPVHERTGRPALWRRWRLGLRPHLGLELSGRPHEGGQGQRPERGPRRCHTRLAPTRNSAFRTRPSPKLTAGGQGSRAGRRSRPGREAARAGAARPGLRAAGREASGAALPGARGQAGIPDRGLALPGGELRGGNPASPPGGARRGRVPSPRGREAPGPPFAAENREAGRPRSPAPGRSGGGAARRPRPAALPPPRHRERRSPHGACPARAAGGPAERARARRRCGVGAGRCGAPGLGAGAGDGRGPGARLCLGRSRAGGAGPGRAGPGPRAGLQPSSGRPGAAFGRELGGGGAEGGGGEGGGGEGGGGSGGGEGPEERGALRLALDQLSLLGLDDEGAAPYGEPRRRSVNMTECVPVPSSEHVAEIVGRQGCKIKALRAKTNTYIKTPVRGEEPVFVVTGRKEDVAMARREIISAAEHFSMIRASRHKSAALSGGAAPGPPALPGQTTIQVRVPYRVVGLVVGPKGATIKRIQQQTHTYIVTPSRDKEPVFEVTGMPENVDRAREEIEAHIALRTGGLVELPDGNDFHANGTDVGFEAHGAGALWSKASPGRKPFASFRNDSSSSLGSASTDSYFGGAGGAAATPRLADFSPPSPALGFAHNGTGSNGAAAFALAAGEAAAPSPDGPEPPPAFDPAPAPPPGAPLLWAPFERSPGPASAAAASAAAASTTASAATAFPAAANAPSGPGPGPRRLLPGSCPRLSPPLHAAPGAGEHRLARRVRSDPGGGGLAFAYAAGLGAPPPADAAGDAARSSSASSSSSSSSSSSCSSSGPRRKGSRDCAVCLESEVIAALVPCGHNLFCLECAHRICQRREPRCPVCHAAVTQAIRIFS
ncbi:RNA-binding protein MEX3B [Dipodomys merriami]|uniref:RNA-binding protein MEX3B n=1 Tax=Dipodomys merriami TaxID=94247 RepID=UPI0038560857